MITYRASGLGSCTRRLTLARVGFDEAETPAKFLEYFARGNVTEEEVKTDLIAAGWLLTDDQLEVVLDITNEIKVVGHIDGKISREDDPKTRLLEIKRMNNAYWNVVRNGGWYVDGLMEKYRWQISAYMLATGLEVCLVCRNGDTGEDHYLYAEEPFYSKNDIAARVLVIEGRARSFTTLADVGECDSADYPCPFYRTHTNAEEEADAGEDSEAIEGLGIAYSVAKERERRAKDEAAGHRKELERVLGDRSTVRAGRVRVTRYVTKRTTLDRKRAESDGIKLSAYESVRESNAMKITVGEDVDDNKADQ